MRKPPKRETSPRFANKPREVFASTPIIPARPVSESVPTDYSGYNMRLIRRMPADKQTNTWRKRGAVMDGPASHLGTVPQAFFR